MSENQAKLVYFNRKETETDCDKVEYENEIFSLRNICELHANEYIYVISYYAPDDNNVYGLYQKQIKANTKKHAEEKFLKWIETLNVDWRLRIKEINFQEEVSQIW